MKDNTNSPRRLLLAESQSAKRSLADISNTDSVAVDRNSFTTWTPTKFNNTNTVTKSNKGQSPFKVFHGDDKMNCKSSFPLQERINVR
jgi:hypothetical protein